MIGLFDRWRATTRALADMTGTTPARVIAEQVATFACGAVLWVCVTLLIVAFSEI